MLCVVLAACRKPFRASLLWIFIYLVFGLLGLFVFLFVLLSFFFCVLFLLDFCGLLAMLFLLHLGDLRVLRVLLVLLVLHVLLVLFEAGKLRRNEQAKAFMFCLTIPTGLRDININSLLTLPSMLHSLLVLNLAQIQNCMPCLNFTAANPEAWLLRFWSILIRASRWLVGACGVHQRPHA